MDSPAGPRERLIEAAIRLLDADGPEAVQARKVAAEIGASTMAVYTHFGGMEQLVEAMAEEGFARLSARFAGVPHTDDPVTDFLRLGLAYRDHARAHPQLFRVMFGIVTPRGYRLGVPDMTEENSSAQAKEAREAKEARGAGEVRESGATAYGYLVDAVRRMIDAGRLRPNDPTLVAAQMWSVVHGYTMLEITGAVGEPDKGLIQVLLPLTQNVLIGLGDTADAVMDSVLRLGG